MRTQLEKEYLKLVLDIETDIGTLEVLQNELHFFYAQLEVDQGLPEQVSVIRSELEEAVRKFNINKDSLLEDMELWFEHTKRMQLPYDINFFRVLKELRLLKSEGK